MAVIAKSEIMHCIETGELAFDPPLDGLQYRPHSIDLRLGFTFRVPKRAIDKDKGRYSVTLDHYAIHGGQFVYYEEFTLKPGQYFDILPDESIMGFSYESIDINSKTLMGIVYPRSSVNRRGLAVDLTGIIDTGYEGHLMFPIRNNNHMQVIRIYPGERVCQLVFERLEQPVHEGYMGRYVHGDSKKRKVSPTFLAEASDREIELLRAGKLHDVKKEFKAPVTKTD